MPTRNLSGTERVFIKTLIEYFTFFVLIRVLKNFTRKIRQQPVRFIG